MEVIIVDTTELCFTPALELSALIRAKTLSPVELCEAVLARVERLNPKLNAFITVTADLARRQAKAAEERARKGALLGPLDGIPYSIKDLEPTAGIRTTFGSRWFVEHVPAEDGVVAARLKATGGVLLGKTNTPHFGHKDCCDNLIGPPCRNPWKLDRTSGASSGGAGAAVAAGLGPVAHGSDGGGSIRIPAALCGIFGFKPSFGRVPYYPSADYWTARAHNGPMTRTVRDAAVLLQAMAGPDPRDPLTIDAPPENYLAACDGDLAGLRVVWSADLGYAAVDPEVRRAAEAAARRFADLGAKLEARDPGWPDPGPFHRVIYEVSAASRQVERAAEHPDWIEPSLMSMIDAARQRLGDRARQGPRPAEHLLQPGPGVLRGLRPPADPADAGRRVVGRARLPPGAGVDRRAADADHVRPAALHFPVQPDWPARRDRALRLHRRGPADRAPDRRALARGRDRAPRGGRLRGAPAMGAAPPTVGLA